MRTFDDIHYYDLTRSDFDRTRRVLTAQLRGQSEDLSLRWGDVDRERGRIAIRSPHTEQHEGNLPHDSTVQGSCDNVCQPLWTKS